MRQRVEPLPQHAERLQKAPVSSHRTRPGCGVRQEPQWAVTGWPGQTGAGFIGCVITEGDDNVDGWYLWTREFLQLFGRQALGRHLEVLEHLERVGVHGAFGVAPGAVGREFLRSQLI